ncbi:MAG TPA: hydroxyacid dehydrogenase [Candidatus Paceibacterota bacterium]|nr:hydroxyacid dehydrogenase [Candidatus Paceibacterota bacterium]
MNIAFFRIEPWEREYIESREEFKKLGAKAVFFDEGLDQDHIPTDTGAEVICTFIDSKITKPVLDAFPNVKLITTRSTGFDHIDLEECKKRGIQVANVPKYGENTVAEYTFGLILALVRKIYHSYDQIRETGSFDLQGMRGMDLKGKTLGVIGTGSIGQNVARIARGFEMQVIACDKYPNQQAAKEVGFDYCEPERAIRESDILTLHVPYTKETHHLINKDNIFTMKKGAYLINTSRGQVIETEALVKALHEGHLGGAALDVFEEEGVIKDELEFLLQGSSEKPDLKTVLANHVLVDMPNVIVTPHNAFNTWEALQRILDTTIQNMRGFQEGKPVNLVG